MIDLHCHILPGIDDGPREMNDALQLGRAIVADGTGTVAATPHLRADHPGVRPEELRERCDELSARLEREAIPLRVVPGGEVDLSWAATATADDLRLVSYGQGGAYLLVETPYGPLTESFEALLFRFVSSRGFQIVLAHPERNPTFQDKPERLEGLARRGVLLQITAPALVSSRRRSRSRRLALWLVERRLAHVIASDAHAPSSWRAPDLSAAVQALSRIAPARAEWMVTEAPAAILAGEPLPDGPDESTAGRRRLRLGRRR